MKLTMTGTGNTHPSLERAGPSQVLEVAGDPLLFDCGEGSLHQLMRAGVPPQDIQTLFLTHLHLDHVGGLTGFIFGSYYLGLRLGDGSPRTPLQIYGPAETEHLLGSLRSAYRVDLSSRDALGLPPEGLFDQISCPLTPGFELRRTDYAISVAPADHGIETYGFRIDYDGGSLVLSGDTTYSTTIVGLARGADVLVHEAHMAASRPTNPVYARGWDRIAAIHSTPEQAGRVAREAGVRRLILTHIRPDADPEEVKKRAATEYTGEVIVAHDLMQIEW